MILFCVASVARREQKHGQTFVPAILHGGSIGVNLSCVIVNAAGKFTRRVVCVSLIFVFSMTILFYVSCIITLPRCSVCRP